MYREVLAEAAEDLGLVVREYDAKTVFAEAAEALEIGDISALLNEIGKVVGSPWRKDHKLATAAAIVAQQENDV